MSVCVVWSLLKGLNVCKNTDMWRVDGSLGEEKALSVSRSIAHVTITKGHRRCKIHIHMLTSRCSPGSMKNTATRKCIGVACSLRVTCSCRESLLISKVNKWCDSQAPPTRFCVVVTTEPYAPPTACKQFALMTPFCAWQQFLSAHVAGPGDMGVSLDMCSHAK